MMWSMSPLLSVISFTKTVTHRETSTGAPMIKAGTTSIWPHLFLQILTAVTCCTLLYHHLVQDHVAVIWPLHALFL